MIKSYKITDTLYINEQIVDTPITESVIAPSHQYIIIDRSGSMWNELDNVADTIIEYVDTLQEGSTVSLGYFSGTNEYGLSVPYELKKEKQGVVATVNSYRNSMGMTNYKEILDKINTDCVNRQGTTALFFFTDGCHNCGPFSSVISTLLQLQPKLDISVFVGCGRIDRDNMIEMAKVCDGSFVQLQKFSEFKQSLLDFNSSVEESVPGCNVVLPYNCENVCSVLGKNIIHYTPNSENSIYYKASNKAKQIVYYTTTTPVGELTEFKKSELGLRTIIYTMVQNNKVPLALDVLNFIGDKYFINHLYNTFTLDEYGKIESDLHKAIFNPKHRYLEGKVVGFSPSPDALCVLDVLNMLVEDDVELHLNDADFEYTAISRKSEQLDGSKMIYPKDIKALANNLKYHESRLNVSLNVNYSAVVPLNPDEFNNTETILENIKNYGLTKGQNYSVNCIRNYNIILDGKVQTPKLVVTKLSKKTLDKLGKHLILRADKKYILDLSGLPVINKSYLSTTSATELGTLCWKNFLVGSELSVIKHLIKANTKIDISESTLDKDAFLAENFYIKNGMYQPPKEPVECTDEYDAYEFNVSFVGFSKPSVPSVIKKVQAGKSCTPRESIIEHYYNKYKTLALTELQALLSVVQRTQREINHEIQVAKFGLILINRGCMDEFSNREDMSLSLDVAHCDTSIDTVTVKFEVTKTKIKI